jgi:hypothetical protein
LRKDLKAVVAAASPLAAFSVTIFAEPADAAEDLPPFSITAVRGGSTD